MLLFWHTVEFFSLYAKGGAHLFSVCLDGIVVDKVRTYGVAVEIEADFMQALQGMHHALVFDLLSYGHLLLSLYPILVLSTRALPTHKFKIVVLHNSL